MGFWQIVNLPCFFDSKASRSITSLKVLEAVDWDTGGACGKLEETRFLLAIPASNSLPEELDNFIRLSVASIVGVFLPILNVNLCNSTNKELELSLIEDIDKISRNQLMETTDERLELLIDTFLNPPFDH